MKKSLLSLSALVLLISGVTFAQTTVLSITELLQGAEFGYTAEQNISVSEMTSSEISFTSPILKDIGGEYVLDYRVSYSPYPIEDLALADNEEILNTVKTKSFTPKSGEDVVEFSLEVEADQLSTGSTYYVTVTPLDMYEYPGYSSQQLCFNFEKGDYALGDACLSYDTVEEHAVATTTTGEHSAAGVDFTLANVSHTIDGNDVTFRWTALDGSDEVDIFVFDIKEEIWKRVATVEMKDEIYVYRMTWDAEHIFEFRPNSGGKEYRYTFNAMRSDPTTPAPEPVIPVTPET